MRWYNAASGSFASVDPYAGNPASPASLAPYMYAYNQPTGFTDPSGRCIPWIESGCEFIGWDNVAQGRLNYNDGWKYAGKTFVAAAGIAATVIACGGTAGLACVAGAAGACAVTSWGDQALDNIGQPLAQAATNVDGGKIVRDALINAASGQIGQDATRLASPLTKKFISSGLVRAITNGGILGSADSGSNKLLNNIFDNDPSTAPGDGVIGSCALGFISGGVSAGADYKVREWLFSKALDYELRNSLIISYQGLLTPWLDLVFGDIKYQHQVIREKPIQILTSNLQNF